MGGLKNINTCKYSHLYLEPDKVIRFNENVFFPEDHNDLAIIEWELPKITTPLHKIDGFGLHPNDQYFDAYRQPMPHKLADLNKKKGMTASEKMQVLEDNQEYYKNEIKWIRREWHRRLYGYVFFNKGKPTYITNDHYWYLVWYKIEDNNPDFRRRCQIHFLFMEFCEMDPNCFGHNYPKMRSDGATHRITSRRINRVTSRSNYKSGIQSKTGDDAEKVHVNLVMPALRELPFFFQPIWDQKTVTNKTRKFFTPEIKDHPDFNKKSLKSFIDFEDSGENAYDSQRMNEIHNDEIGKCIDANVQTRAYIQRKCLLDNGRKRGEMHNTSTVNEMEAKGGMAFYELAKESHYHAPNNKDKHGNEIPGRDKVTGKTISWLYNLFIPSYEGFVIDDPATGYKSIDKYGFTDIKKTHELINATFQQFRDTGNTAGLIEEMRQTPMRWRHCWMMSAKDCNFNLAIIEDRLNYYNDHVAGYRADTVQGNFKWVNDQRDTRVEFVQCENGRFFVSYLFDNEQKDANRKFLADNVWFPDPEMARKFKAGGDPYKFKKKSDANATKNGRSKGGGAVVRARDKAIDPDTKSKALWETYDIAVTYSHRHPNQELYGEDMIMMCVYYGAPMNAETNVDFLVRYFSERGYAGYLHYEIDKKGETKSEAGSDTNTKTKEDIYTTIEDYIQVHGARCKHPEFLEQCKYLEDDLGPYDMLVAVGKALIAAKQVDTFIDRKLSVTDLSQFFAPGFGTLANY